MRIANLLHRIAKDAELRPVPVFQNNFQPSVMVEVGERETIGCRRGTSNPDPPETSENVPSLIVHVENISLVAVPRRVGPDQLIDRVPPAFVIRRTGWHLCGDFATTCRQKKLDKSPRSRSGLIVPEM